MRTYKRADIRLKSWSLILIAISVSFFQSGCASLENRFIYAPSVYPNNWNSITHDCIEEVWFDSDDGQQLHGLLAHHPAPRAVILFAHGREGNVTTPVKSLVEFVDQHRVSVLIFDYRGYGKSSGEPNENGLYRDARAARQFLAAAYQIPEQEIILMGRSLGAAVAIDLAAKDGAKALIVECGFTSLPDIIKHHAPPVPAKAIVASRFDSLNKIKNYVGPALFSHGTDDQIIPFRQGQQLFAAASGPKQFVPIENGQHDSESPAYYVKALDDFIEDVVGGEFFYGSASISFRQDSSTRFTSTTR